MPQVTPGGVEALATRQSRKSDQEQKEETDSVVVQVLAVLRYVADPEVRKLLGETTWHVFDLVISDGDQTMACALDPKLNALVWQGQLMPMDLLEVLDWSILDATDEDRADDIVRCVLRRVAVMRQPSQDIVVNKKTTKVSLQRQMQALSTKPLLGGRQYYLPLLSDYYSSDWLEDSAIEDRTRIRWSLQRENCTDLSVGTSNSKVFLKTIKEVRELVESAETPLSLSFPPLVGIVQFKSSLKHIADPAVADPFPFAFHLKLVDRNSAVDVIFFGSMCAKYFLAINDGDVVQLTNYSIDKRPDGTVEYLYEHLSTGYVRHVPERYWKLLDRIHLLPTPRWNGNEGGDSPGNAIEFPSELVSRILWVPWAFSSTLDTRYWPAVKKTMPRFNENSKYFDFVGMVSFVGRVFRLWHQSSQQDDSKRAKNEGVGETIMDDVRSFRWVKVIDRSSANELVIKVFDCSQPSIFRKLKVGIEVVLTKLRWVAFDSVATAAGESISGLNGLEDATTSEFSSLFTEDATSAFECIEECRANTFFAKSFRDRHDIIVSSSSGDSWLASERYYPRHFMPTEKVDDFVSAFHLNLIPGSQLDRVCDTIDAFSGAHVGILGNLVGIQLNESSDAVVVEIDLNDGRTVKATVRRNPFFKHKSLPRSVRASAQPAVTALLRALPIAVVGKLMDARSSSPPQRKRPRTIEASSDSMTVSFLEEQLKEHEFLCSMHLYRNEYGRMFIEVDALLST